MKMFYVNFHRSNLSNLLLCIFSFDAIENGIFKILFSSCLWLVCKTIIDFCILTIQPTIRLNSLISPASIFVDYIDRSTPFIYVSRVYINMVMQQTRIEGLSYLASMALTSYHFHFHIICTLILGCICRKMSLIMCDCSSLKFLWALPSERLKKRNETSLLGACQSLSFTIVTICLFAPSFIHFLHSFIHSYFRLQW